METIVKLKGLQSLKKQLDGLDLRIRQQGHYSFEIINSKAPHKREETIIFFNIKDGYFSIKSYNINKVSNENLIVAIRLVEEFQKNNRNYNPFNFFGYS